MVDDDEDSLDKRRSIVVMTSLRNSAFVFEFFNGWCSLVVTWVVLGLPMLVLGAAS